MAQPSQRTSFFGRERERAWLADLLACSPLVTITGVGGVGKTRLAGELAAADAGPVHWCELSAIADEGDVAPAVASALGRDRAPGTDAVMDAINERGGLLVLDNCEHVVRAVAELADTVLDSCPDPRILCTSREPLGVEGEALLALDQLAAEDAIALFVDRARMARWDFELDGGNASAVARVCGRLDGLPLAIELAAARVRSLSPAEIAEHLDERFSLLARPRARSGERHRTLRATVDWSYRLLEESEKRAFERLSVFVAGWDLEAAEAVCEGPALELLDRLVERSLVRTDDSTGRTRYAMLETLRHYARDRLAERGELELAAELHAEHFARVAGRARHNAEMVWDVALLRYVKDLFGDARAAVHWSVRERPNRERALRIVAPLWSLAHSRHATEAAELCEEALAAWPREYDELGQAALGSAAGTNFVAGRPEAAQRYAAEAIAAEEQGAPSAVIARRALALVTYGFLGQVEAGLERLDEVVQAARESGLRAVELEMRVLRAQALAAAGRLDEALAEGEATRDEAEDQSSPEMLAWAVYILGTVLKARGDERSEHCFNQSLELARQLQYPLVLGTSMRQLAAVWLGQERREAEGAALLAQAYEHFAGNGDRPQVWDVLRTAAPLLAKSGQPDLAAQVLAGSHHDPRAREPAPLEVAAIRELRDRLAQQVEIASAAPANVEDLGPAVLGQLRAIADSKCGPVATSPRPEQPVFRQEGDLWALGFEGQTVHLPDLKGLHDLARLLAEPGQEFHCLELSGAPRAASGDGAGEDLGLQGHAGELLDERAKAEYKQRILDLRDEAELAQAANDDERAQRAREELETLTEALASAFGLGGRPRTAGDPAERARTAVAWRLRSALSKIDAAHPDLARHLRNSVRTGVFCSYQPERPVSWVT